MVQALDRYAIDTMRVLAADVTSATNSGHPGTSIHELDEYIFDILQHV